MTGNATTLHGVALVTPLLLAGFWPDLAQACSLASVEASREESIRLSSYYWIGSAVLGAMCVAAGLYRGRWVPSLVLVAAVLIFHPRWIVAPQYGADCRFRNVEASELVFAAIGVLLSYHLFRIFRARTQPQADS